MQRRISPFWRTWFPFSTSIWIREYLAGIYPEDDYVWGMWQKCRVAFVEWWKRERVERKLIPLPIRVMEMKFGTYQNFCNYFYWLRRLGLVEFTRSEPGIPERMEGKLVPRNYYRISPLGLETPPEDLRWRNPRRALYEWSWKGRGSS